MSRPEHIGKYEVLEEIGRGGMGIVYKALHPVLDRYVAIKVLPEYMARQDPEFGKRFLREARIMVDLHHQGIVRVIDADTWEGSLYLVMEFIDGWTIRQVMAGTPLQGVQPPFSLTVERSVDILKQVAGALGYARQRGIIHRDIKPSNILIDKDGHTWITDFGIAKSLSGTTMATQAGVSLGTPEYMAPEQFAESELSTVDGRSDIYSLGCVVYEMLTGKVPFAGETPLGVAYKHVNLPCPHLRQFNPRISPALERIVLTMLAKDRTERYATCEDLLADLHRYEEDERKNLQTATMKTEEAGPGAVVESGEPGTVTTTPAAPVPDEEATVLRKEAGEPQTQAAASEKSTEPESRARHAGENPVVEQATIVSAHPLATTAQKPEPAESRPEEAPTVVAASGTWRLNHQESNQPEQSAVRVTEPKRTKRRTPLIVGIALALAVLIPLTILLVRGMKPAPTAVVPSTATVSLSITSTPPGAEVSLDGTSIGTTPVQGYQTSVGSHTVILRMSGYNDTTATFDLSQGETSKTLSFPLTASSPPDTATPVASPVSVPVSITSNPSGAKVSIDGVFKGVTPLTVSLKPGTYTLGMSKDGYKAYQGTVEVLKTDTARTVPVTLSKETVTPATATLTVTSTPSGAKVYMLYWGEAYIGTTPMTTILNPGPGTYSLRLTLTGYQDHTESVAVKAGGTASVNVLLAKLPVTPTTATLTVTSTPSGAKIFMDGASIGTTPITKTVVSGTHALRLTLAGYNDYLTTVTLQEGGSKPIAATLTRQPVVPTMGTLTVTSVPSGAQVFLDGASIGTAPIISRSVSLGPHGLRVSLTGYEDYTISFVAGSFPYEVNALLQEKTSYISVASVPSGAQVYLDGTSIGVTPISQKTVSPGTHTVRVTKAGYLDYSETITVSRGSTQPVNSTLSRLSGTLSITSIPSGASVSVGGVSKGITPLTVTVDPGTYVVTMVREGYQEWGKTVATSAGSTTVVDARLVPCFALIAAGWDHSLAIARDGSLWSWGSNDRGQLGDGTTTSRSTPVRVGDRTDWKAIAAGSEHSLALAGDGSLWAWGGDCHGQLGNGTLDCSLPFPTPTRVGTRTDWKSIGAGFCQSFAIAGDGSVWACGFQGNAAFGVLGLTATLHNIGGAWSAMATGFDRSVGIFSDGSLWAIGFGGCGETPCCIDRRQDWTSVAVGTSHAMATMRDGSLWEWGQTSPVRVGDRSDWLAVAGGGSFTVAVARDGSLWEWEIGATPVRVGARTDWAKISAADEQCLALARDGSVWQWSGGFSSSPVRVGSGG